MLATGASAGVARAGGGAVPPSPCPARGQEGLEQAAHGVRAAGGQALPYAVDVTDPDAADAAAQQAEEQLGRRSTYG